VSIQLAHRCRGGSGAAIAARFSASSASSTASSSAWPSMAAETSAPRRDLRVGSAAERAIFLLLRFRIVVTSGLRTALTASANPMAARASLLRRMLAIRSSSYAEGGSCSMVQVRRERSDERSGSVTTTLKTQKCVQKKKKSSRRFHMNHS